MDDDLFLSAEIAPNRSLCISSLSSRIYQECASDAFPTERGFFVYEQDHGPAGGGIAVLAKVASLEAAYRFFEIFTQRLAANNPSRPG